MKSSLVFFFFFILLIPGCNEKRENHFILEGNFQAILKMAQQQNKNIWMLLGGGKDCLACNQFFFDIEKNYIVTNYKENYIFYKCNVSDPANKCLQYIFLMESIPNSYIISPKGQLISYYSKNLDTEVVKNQLDAVARKQPSYPSSHTQFKSKAGKLLELQNLLLTAQLTYDESPRDSINLKNILALVQKSIDIEPCFYNLYLASKIYHQLQDTLHSQIYAQEALQICPSGFQTIVYTRLIHELQHFLPLNDSIQEFYPQIVFDQTQLDLKPDKQEYCFHFTNTGTKPLLIKQVASSCSCAKPQWPKHPILPGKKGEIIIHYHTKKEGIINRTFWIETNTLSRVEKIILKTNI